MADEAVPIETPTRFARVTVADGTAIPLHSLLKLTDPNTGIIHSGDADPFAGIAWEEKTASDGITEIVVALNGVWDLTDAGAGFGVTISSISVSVDFLYRDLQADLDMSGTYYYGPSGDVTGTKTLDGSDAKLVIRGFSLGLGGSFAF